MKNLLFLFGATAMILSACGTPSEVLIQTAIAETQAAITPTVEPTSTPVPLKEIDVSDTLVMPGDLPAGYSAAQLRDEPSPRYREVPEADKTTLLQLEHSGKNGGAVAVFLYEDMSKVQPAYDALVETLGDEGSQNIKDLGEQAFGWSVNFQSMIVVSELAFTRCNLVVHVELNGIKDLPAAISYAKRLDKRLAPLFCR